MCSGSIGGLRGKAENASRNGILAVSSSPMPVRQRKPKHIETSSDAVANRFGDTLLPQTPDGSVTPVRASSPVGTRRKISPWLRWVVQPVQSFKLLLIPLVLYINWELFTPQLQAAIAPLAPSLIHDGRLANPFAGIFLLSHRIPESDPSDPRYAKGWFDLAFLAYYVVFFSCFRQLVTINTFGPIAKYFGLKKEAKIDRFGEQGYALVYFALSGFWGFRVMSQLPTFWYRTEYFWIDYPHWDMKPELKRYYLMQMAYWLQQLIVLVLGLEKPRKDFYELVAHHIVTLWLVGWSYLVNLTLIGNAVYMSMDLPDTTFALSKLLNYIEWNRAKLFSFAFFVCVWTYFRHYLNLVILWSVWTQFDLIPDHARRWVWSEGVYMVGWMKYQIFAPLLLLQCLNLFWYFLIWRVAVRAIMTVDLNDDRSDDEGDD
ncbi:longevity-assurance protein 1 [Roridomyces roridus]|uniref:Longevity-assurance protein 1 n=1 Tax=Roridomyces roridus TaxID=1738132 RepID=A0AAD7FUP2_9AGAR|nr:longevity-assurance protein 1 [Roridomyces roridus]